MSGLWVVIPDRIGNNRGGSMELAGVDLGNGYAALAVAETQPIGAGRANATTATSATTDAILLPARSDRRSATIFNDSTAVLSVRYGFDAASTSVYSEQVAAGATIPIPAGYTGEVHGVWASANGQARITEFRPLGTLAVGASSMTMSSAGYAGAEARGTGAASMSIHSAGVGAAT